MFIFQTTRRFSLNWFVAVLLVLILSSGTILFSIQQEFRFQHLTIDEGLSDNDVTSIVEDHHGFIWIGTRNGLNRYDGSEFIIYQHDRNDSTSIISSFVRQLFVSSDGTIWIGTELGLSKYNYELDCFINYSGSQSTPNSLSGYSIECLAEDKAGNLYIGTDDGGLNYLNVKRNVIKHLNFDNNLRPPFSNTVRSIKIDYNQRIWIAGFRGLYRYDPVADSTWIINAVSKDKKELSQLNIIDIDVTREGYLLLGSNSNGLYIYKPEQNELVLYGPPEVFFNITSIYNDKKNQFWVGISEGFVIIDKNRNDYHVYNNMVEEFRRQSISTMVCFLQDSNDNIWLGHHHRGISISAEKQNFRLLNQTVNGRLENDEVCAVFKDSKNRLWIGYWSGNIELIDLKSEKTKFIITKSADGKNHSGTIFIVFEDSRHQIWMGSNRGGLQRFNEKTKDFEVVASYNKKGNYISFDDIRWILEDDNHNFWLAGHVRGMDVYNVSSGKLIRNYRSDESSGNGINNNWNFCLAKDKMGNIWLGSAWGVNVIEADGKIRCYIYEKGDSTSLIGNFVNTIFRDSKNQMWIGTNEGLCCYNYHSDNFSWFTSMDGLPGNSIMGILEDHRGNLWISTKNGLSKFNPVARKFTNYSITDGIQGKAFFPRSAFCAEDGEMYFGGYRGLTVFNPDEIVEDTTSPKVVLTDFQIYNKSVKIGEKIDNNIVLKKSLIETEEVRLTHKEKVFSIFYSALEFKSNENIQYYYRLIGFEKDDNNWHCNDNRRLLTFTNLAPGEYTFEIKAGIGDVIPENIEPTRLKIFIKPPFWNTLWFKTLMVIIFLGSTYSVFRVRFHIIKRQKVELEKMVGKRTAELSRANSQLKERQVQVENQKEELQAQSDKLLEVNRALTKQKEELKKLNATKDKFFSIIAHDLKNPFNTILGLSDILHSRLKSMSSERIERMVMIINESSVKVYNLLENLLQWARSQTDSIRYIYENHRLTQLIDDTVSILEELAKEKKNIINTEISEDLEIYADKTTMGVVMLNILTNAIKFTSEGVIKITSKRLDGNIECIIEDNGVGMDKESLDNLFRIDQATQTIGTDGEHGTGLGLIICKELVQQNNGTLKIESEVDKGTKVIITIPSAKYN